MMHRSSKLAGEGNKYGTVSGNFTAYNPLHRPGSISSERPFSVAGFYASVLSKHDAGTNVLVEAFDNSGGSGESIGSYEITLGDPRARGPTFIDLRGGDFEGIYGVKITPSHAYYTQPWIVIDDMIVY